MKKPLSFLFAALAVFLVAFTVGFFLGRNTVRSDIRITFPETTAPAIAADTGMDNPVNINTAGVYELASLPGIGETIAERIVQYRTEHGAFSSPGELLNVYGIGTTKLERILDLITTGG